MNVQKREMKNGLMVATEAMPHLRSVSLGVWIKCGSRFEEKKNAGISHFIEHLMFKGTKMRSAKQITESVEGIGGYLNAFTGEETTCYYAKASHNHFDTLLDVLADMYLHSRFTATDIDKEREWMQPMEELPSRLGMDLRGYVEADFA